MKFGFRESPTDYYLRPYWLSLYDTLSYPPSKSNSNLKPCYYNKLIHQLSFDWILEFEKFYSDSKFRQNVPRFGLIKLNEMSHDYMERIAWIDDDLKQLLVNLFTEKFLDNTFFVLMGDHGHRTHQIRETFIGKLEEKLPLFSMILPNKLIKKKRSIYDNISKNTKSILFKYLSSILFI